MRDQLQRLHASSQEVRSEGQGAGSADPPEKPSKDLQLNPSGLEGPESGRGRAGNGDVPGAHADRSILMGGGAHGAYDNNASATSTAVDQEHLVPTEEARGQSGGFLGIVRDRARVGEELGPTAVTTHLPHCTYLKGVVPEGGAEPREVRGRPGGFMGSVRGRSRADEEKGPTPVTTHLSESTHPKNPRPGGSARARAFAIRGGRRGHCAYD